MSGNAAVVGAFAGTGSGAAYMYLKGASGWLTTPTATLNDPGMTPPFGDSVAVSETIAIVGGYPTDGFAGAADIYKA